MQIILNQAEIEEAIRNHVHGQVTIRESQEMSIDLRAGRGENGFTAELDIQPRPTTGSTVQGITTDANALSKIAVVVPVENPDDDDTSQAPAEAKKAEKPKKTSKAAKPAAKKTGIFGTTGQSKPAAADAPEEASAPSEDDDGKADAAETTENDPPVTDAADEETTAPSEKKSIFAFASKSSAG